MNILQVVLYITPGRGGEVNVCYNLSAQLVRHGHKVTVLTTDLEYVPEYAHSLGDSGVTVIPFHCLANIHGFLVSPGMNRWLRNHLNEFDIVHFHSYRSYQNLVISWHARKYGIPYVISGHNDAPRITGKAFLKAIYDYSFGNYVINRACKLIANSRAELSYYKATHTFQERLELVYNGVEYLQPERVPPMGMFKKKYGIESRYILFLGRMDRTKGLHFLVQGFASLVNVLDYPVCLVMIGPEGVASGPTRIAVQKMKILDKVRWVFPVTQEEKLAAYRDADLFVTTANYRSGGILTALEAIQCGTPAVVTEEVAEFFENADLRDCIVKYGNLEQFRNAMRYFLDNPREGQVVVERGRKYITEHLLWPKVVKQFEQIYEDCVKK